MRRIVREVDPDVLQGWMYHGNLAASRRSGGRPVLWNVRQRLERLSDNGLATRAVILGSLAWRGSVRRVIYNSARAAAEHEAWGYPADRRALIPNGFDLSRFAPDAAAPGWLRGELGLPSGAPLIARVARDDAIKDNATLAAAFAQAGAGLHLALVGRGMDSANARLRALFEARGVAGRVHFMGERGGRRPSAGRRRPRRAVLQPWRGLPQRGVRGDGGGGAGRDH